MEHNNSFVDIEPQENNFVQIETLEEGATQLAVEAVCACGFGMGLCCWFFEPGK
jgi:hypothetical protein